MSTPLWRQLYNAWEEAVTPGLQEVTASNGFRDVLAAGMKVNADVNRELERMSRQWLHLLNLPAATDVRRLRQQVASLEREVVGLRLELEATTKAEPTTRRSTGSTTRKAASKAAKGSGDIELTTVTSANGRSAKA